MAYTELSVIIVTLQDNPDDIASVSRLRELNYDFELIIRRDEGISKARNNGIAAASHDKIIFLDDDAIPEPGYLEAASKALDKHPVVVGAVQSPHKDVFDELAVHYRDPDTLVGCNMGFRREVFENVGYFDEDFHWGHEETEFQNRLTNEYDLFYEPGMLVKHAYAKNFTDYIHKMWKLGTVDIDYWIKAGNKSDLGHIVSLNAYLSSSFKGTLYKSIGRTVRNISAVKSLLRNPFKA